jgi:hypothetical protein
MREMLWWQAKQTSKAFYAAFVRVSGALLHKRMNDHELHLMCTEVSDQNGIDPPCTVRNALENVLSGLPFHESVSLRCFGPISLVPTLSSR